MDPEHKARDDNGEFDTAVEILLVSAYSMSRCLQEPGGSPLLVRLLRTSQSKLDQHRMVIARPIAGGALRDLAVDNLDRVVGQYMVDAHGRALVRIDEVG